MAQSLDAAHKAARWDALGSAAGVAAGGLSVALAAGLIWWIKTRALAPAVALAETMERFGRGDREARAEHQGAAELQIMVRRFNEMASALAAQRGAQMRFLAGVAHDLKNPLSVLQMSVGTIRPHDPMPPEPRLRHTLEVLGRQIQRLDRM